MAKSLNRTTLLGRIGNDLELKQSKGYTYTEISLAISNNTLDKSTKTWVTGTDWFRIVAYGDKAETLSKYCKKGDWLFVELRLRNKSSLNPQTNKTTNIIDLALVDFILLGSKKAEKVKPNDDDFSQFEDDEHEIPFI